MQNFNSRALAFAMFSRTRSRSLNPWIVSCILAFDPHDNVKNVFNKAKAVKINGDITRDADSKKERVKEVTDGVVFIDAVFTEKCLEEFEKEFDDEIVPQWNQALVIFKDFSLEYRNDEVLENSKFMLQVLKLDLWDLQQGFYLKNTPTWCMYDKRVKQKSVEIWNTLRLMRDSLDSQSSFEEYHSISQLVEEMAEDNEEGESMGTDGEPSPSRSEKPQASPITELRDYNCLNFVIIEKDEKILESLKDWKTDYIPECSVGSSDQTTSTPSAEPEYLETLRNEKSSIFGRSKTKNQKESRNFNECSGIETDNIQECFKSCENSDAKRVSDQHQMKTQSSVKSCDSTTGSSKNRNSCTMMELDESYNVEQLCDDEPVHLESSSSPASQVFYQSTCPFSPILTSDDHAVTCSEVVTSNRSSTEIMHEIDQKEEERLTKLAATHTSKQSSCISPMKRLKLDEGEDANAAQGVQFSADFATFDKKEKLKQICERHEKRVKESTFQNLWQASGSSHFGMNNEESEIGSLHLEKVMDDNYSQLEHSAEMYDSPAFDSRYRKAKPTEDMHIISCDTKNRKAKPIEPSSGISSIVDQQDEIDADSNENENVQTQTFQIGQYSKWTGEDQEYSMNNGSSCTSEIDFAPLHPEENSVFKVPSAVAECRVDNSECSERRNQDVPFQNKPMTEQDSLLTPQFFKDFSPLHPVLCSGSVISTPVNSLPCYQTHNTVSWQSEVKSQQFLTDVEILLDKHSTDSDTGTGRAFRFSPPLLQKIHYVLNKNKVN